MTNRLDIVIFGATGFTAKYALIQAHKLFRNISWGIAGRNETKLKQALQDSAKNAGISEFSYIPIIFANAEDEATIKKMTGQAKVLINCCGPCDMYNGETIVKCCIETGTHYVDVSAEDLFITKILLKYKELAEDKGIYIVNLCGFNSLPFDLGVCFLEEKFEGTLNSIEIYLHSQRDKSACTGSSINYTTWISVVNSMAKHKEIKNIKKRLGEKKHVEVKPKLTTKLPHRVPYGLAVPFPGGDEETVRRSQLFFYEQDGKRPVQIRNYLIMDSFYTIIITIILGLICFVLSQFSFGIKILLKYPDIFTNGTFSTKSPSEDTVNKRQFSMLFKGKGWKNKLHDAVQYNPQPDTEVIGCVSGSNPGYGVTALSLVLSALVILLEPTKLPPRGGIYTPAAAFSKTSIIEQLQNNGIKFEITSIAELK